MKEYSTMSINRLQKTLLNQLNTTERILEKRTQKFHEISELLSRKIYEDRYYYLYEEYIRKKHKRIKKRSMEIKSSDFITAREVVLYYCNHRRNVFAVLGTNAKCYNQVLLVSEKTNEKFFIAGGTFEDNLYGLAWEASILVNKTLPVEDWRHWVNKFYTKNGVQYYFPGFNSNSINLDQVTYPKIFSSQLDVTIDFTLRNMCSGQQFMKEIKAFEDKSLKLN